MLYWISITSSYYLKPIYPILILCYFIKFFFLSSLEINLVSFVILLSDSQYAASHPFPSLLYLFPSLPFLLFISPFYTLVFNTISCSPLLLSIIFHLFIFTLLALHPLHSTALHSTALYCTATFLFLPALITSWTSETWSQTTSWIFPWCAWHSKRVSCKRTGISLRTSSTRRLRSYTVVTSITSHNRTPRECWALES